MTFMIDFLYVLVGVTVASLCFLFFWLFLKITLTLKKIVISISYEVRFISRLWYNFIDFFKGENGK